jgi:hypothetical protein
LILAKLPNGTVQITGDKINIERSIAAYLMLNRQYTFLLRSDNRPNKVIGVYTADVSGGKNIQLYDINYNLQSTNTPLFTALTIVNNYTNAKSAIAYYNDPYNKTTDLKYQIVNTITRAVEIEYPLGAVQNAQLTLNLSLYPNKTIQGTWKTTRDGIQSNYSTPIQREHQIIKTYS